jgi:hypothetical protein
MDVLITKVRQDSHSAATPSSHAGNRCMLVPEEQLNKCKVTVKQHSAASICSYSTKGWTHTKLFILPPVLTAAYHFSLGSHARYLNWLAINSEIKITRQAACAAGCDPKMPNPAEPYVENPAQKLQ